MLLWGRILSMRAIEEEIDLVMEDREGTVLPGKGHFWDSVMPLCPSF